MFSFGKNLRGRMFDQQKASFDADTKQRLAAQRSQLRQQLMGAMDGLGLGSGNTPVERMEEITALIEGDFSGIEGNVGSGQKPLFMDPDAALAGPVDTRRGPFGRTGAGNRLLEQQRQEEINRRLETEGLRLSDMGALIDSFVASGRNPAEIMDIIDSLSREDWSVYERIDGDRFPKTPAEQAPQPNPSPGAGAPSNGAPGEAPGKTPTPQEQFLADLESNPHFRNRDKQPVPGAVWTSGPFGPGWYIAVTTGALGSGTIWTPVTEVPSSAPRAPRPGAVPRAQTGAVKSATDTGLGVGSQLRTGGNKGTNQVLSGDLNEAMQGPVGFTGVQHSQLVDDILKDWRPSRRAMQAVHTNNDWGLWKEEQARFVREQTNGIFSEVDTNLEQKVRQVANAIAPNTFGDDEVQAIVNRYNDKRRGNPTLNIADVAKEYFNSDAYKKTIASRRFNNVMRSDNSKWSQLTNSDPNFQNTLRGIIEQLGPGATDEEIRAAIATIWN